jgi:hypothetical protein
MGGITGGTATGVTVFGCVRMASIMSSSLPNTAAPPAVVLVDQRGSGMDQKTYANAFIYTRVTCVTAWPRVVAISFRDLPALSAWVNGSLRVHRQYSPLAHMVIAIVRL